ncbi:MAG: GyrI-like domain-containing protein [Culicoidibacterales bacterium]
MMEYTIETKPAMMLAGYTMEVTAETTQLINQLWELFLATWQKVDYANHQAFYTIQSQAKSEQLGAFNYSVAIEVEGFGELPEGMEYLDLAAMEYACFTATQAQPVEQLYAEMEHTLRADHITFLSDYTLERYPSTNPTQVQILVPLRETAEN